jgi:hypothetical protein
LVSILPSLDMHGEGIETAAEGSLAIEEFEMR